MHVTTGASHKDRSIEIGLTDEDGLRMWPQEWDSMKTTERVRRLAQACDLMAVKYAEDEGWLSAEYAQRRRHEIATRGNSGSA